jgi:comEA protein
MRTLVFIAAVLGAGVVGRSASADVSAPVAAVTVKAAEPIGAGTININTATVDELDRLPGVGPTKAEAIAAFRAKHGVFKRIDDLDRVKGFGRKLISKVRPYVSLSGPTTYIGKPHSKKDVRPIAEHAMK